MLKLCEYIELYSAKLPLSHVEPINIKGLVALDLFHFGWNIWNHFKVGKQDEISQFLKQVFAITFKDVEVGSIKSFQSNKNISIGIALILNPRRSLLIWLWQLPYCFVSLVGNYFLWQSKQQYKDEALKFRIIRVWRGCSPKEILWLNDVFDIHRNKTAIKNIKKQIDGYELGLKQKADSLLQRKIVD